MIAILAIVIVVATVVVSVGLSKLKQSLDTIAGILSAELGKETEYWKKEKRSVEALGLWALGHPEDEDPPPAPNPPAIIAISNNLAEINRRLAATPDKILK